MGRFINADAYASTGQGVLGNNMFAYCLNNSVCFADYHGTKVEQFPIPFEGETIIDKWKKQGVEFIPNETNGGGQIRNSYKITDPDEMYQYAQYLRKNTDYFSGSVEAMVFEWQVHNIIYASVNKSHPWSEKAKHVDLGRTIYNDNHGKMSELMINAFELWNPAQAQNDFLIYLNISGGQQ